MDTGLKKLFVPSDKFISVLSPEKSDITTIYSIYDALELYPDQSEKGLAKYSDLLLTGILNSTYHLIESHFDERGYNMHQKYSREWSCIIYETIHNSLDHGPKENPFTMATFLGPLGIGFGFYDGGKFYKLASTKKDFENDSPIPSNSFPSPRNIGVSGGNCGLDEVRKFASFLEIDIEKGVLYCAVSKNDLFVDF